MPIIKDAVLLYAKVVKPTLEYQKEAVADKPHMNKEFVVDVLMTEAWYKKTKKAYKTVKAVRECTVLDETEFKEKFKIDAPAGYANEDGELFIVKFRKKAYYNDGNKGYAPNVLASNRQAGTDRVGNPITAETELGNGTLAQVAFKERTWDNKFGKGLALDLQAICVTNLVKYESAGGDAPEFEFDEDGFDQDVPLNGGDGSATPSAGEGGAKKDDGNW